MSHKTAVSREKVAPAVQELLATLRRIPDDVVLSMATREIDMWDPNTCICGWAFREMVGGESGLTSDLFANKLLPLFGGSVDEWTNVYGGGSESEIEEAFTRRVMECVK